MKTSCLLFIYLTIVQFCFKTYVSGSSTPLLLPLSHSLSTSKHSHSPLHILKSSSSRSSARFRRHHHHKRQQQLHLPLSSGSDYLLSLSVGSSSSVSLYLDTGSDLVWYPCRPFTCILCESEPLPPSPPSALSSSASTVPCSSPSCSAAHSSLPSSDLCAIANCPLDFIETGDCNTSSYPCPPFYYAYGDGSLVARLFSDTLSLPQVSVSNFTFGCAHTALAETIGVAGFGRGRLSLPAQLASYSPHFGNSFSYCLLSHSFDSKRLRLPSPLILGRFNHDKHKRVGTHDDDDDDDDDKTDFVYTEMLENPKHPYFYSVSLQGISVGKRFIPAPAMLRQIDSNGSGGIVVDSGTTFTMLPAKFYKSVVEEFDRRVGRVHERVDRVESHTGMTHCYYFNQTVRVPALVLHFAGNGSSVTLPMRNYFYEFMDGGDGKRKVGCLMLMDGGDESELKGGTGAILGNYQQQGFEVVYDLFNRKVGFAKRKCASLWDTLNRA